MTVLAETEIENGYLFSNVKPAKEAKTFIKNSVMKPEGICEDDKKQRLENIKNAMYTPEDNFPKSVPVSKPKNYREPDVKSGKVKLNGKIIKSKVTKSGDSN